MAKNNDENKDPTFTIINKNTVSRLKRNGKIDVPAKKVDVPKDKRWNEKQMGSKILQGILNGDSVQKMSESMKEVVGNNMNSAVRQVRTMTTSAECNGRLDSYRALASKGVVLKKVWIATPDHRTRESHLEIDGQEKEIEKPFGNGCMFPSDAKAAPEEVWNCRCTMRSHILGVRLPDGSIEYTGIDRDETSHDRQMDAEKDRREKEGKNKPIIKKSQSGTGEKSNSVSKVKKWGMHEKGDNSDAEASRILDLAGIKHMNGDVFADIRTDGGKGEQYWKDRIKLYDDDKEVILIINHNTGEVYIDSIFVKDKGKGIGTKILTEIKEQAEEQGYKTLTAYAAGDFNTILSGHGYNGYYSLARFGFDGEIWEGLRDEAKKLFGATTIQEIMQTAEGREWWKNHGTGFEAKIILKKKTKKKRKRGKK